MAPAPKDGAAALSMMEKRASSSINLASCARGYGVELDIRSMLWIFA